MDPATGKVVARVGVGEGPHEVTVSADGKFAYVGNYGQQTPGNTISVIDLPAQAELRRVDLGPLRRPHGMLFVDGKLYFTAELNRLIARYDPVANKVDWLFGTGQATTHMLVANADASLIFTANIGSNSVSAIERGSRSGRLERDRDSGGQRTGRHRLVARRQRGVDRHGRRRRRVDHRCRFEKSDRDVAASGPSAPIA